MHSKQTKLPAVEDELTDGQFLTGPKLSAAIRHVLKGSKRRCAVALWGIGSDDLLKTSSDDYDDLHVVCDISMGVCHPKALSALGAPNNRAIRYRDGLHAKVYLSDRGVVTSSANASKNGVGFSETDAALVEAGTFHMPGSQAWQAAAEWFSALYADAKQVDEAALMRARDLFRPGRRGAAFAERRAGSLIDMVIDKPEHFNDVGFVLVNTSLTTTERDKAIQSAIKAGIQREIIEDSKSHVFGGWDEKEILRWPSAFIEFWMPGDHLYLYARSVVALDPAGGSAFARRDKRAVAKLLPADLPDFTSAASIDASVIKRLLSEGGRVFRTGTEFANALTTEAD